MGSKGGNVDRNPGTAQSRAAAAQPAYQPPAPPQFEAYTGPTAAELEAERVAREEENRITKGLNDRDALYSQYLNSSESATDYVNSQIDQERANARLTGTDYEITDEQKAERINDYFATLWSSGEQTQIDSLFNEFGTPQGFTEFTVIRGKEAEPSTTPDSTQEATSSGKGGTLIADDEDLLGSTSLLGG